MLIAIATGRGVEPPVIPSPRIGTLRLSNLPTCSTISLGIKPVPYATLPIFTQPD